MDLRFITVDEMILLIPVFLILIDAAYLDIKKRKFPNTLFLIMSGYGLFFSIVEHHWQASLSYYIILILAGIFFLCPKMSLKAGDSKFFSALFFYFDPSTWINLRGFCIVLFSGMIIIGLCFLLNYYNNNLKKIGQHIKKEFQRICFLFIGQEKMANMAVAGLDSEYTIPLVAELSFIFFIYIYIHYFLQIL